MVTGLNIKEIEKCTGYVDSGSDNPLLKQEKEAQGSWKGALFRRPYVLVLRKLRNLLPACLADDIETNECLDNNGGCWQDKVNITACKDTFRGRVCECQLVNGVQFKGDGYSTCEASGPGRCMVNHGGCWHETRIGQTLPLVWIVFLWRQNSRVKGIVFLWRQNSRVRGVVELWWKMGGSGI